MTPRRRLQIVHWHSDGATISWGRRFSKFSSSRYCRRKHDIYYIIYQVPVCRSYWHPFCRQPLCTVGRPRRRRYSWFWKCSSAWWTVRRKRIACSRALNGQSFNSSKLNLPFFVRRQFPRKKKNIYIYSKMTDDIQILCVMWLSPECCTRHTRANETTTVV